MHSLYLLFHCSAPSLLYQHGHSVVVFHLKGLIEYNGPIPAPIKQDDIVGKLKIFYKDDLINEYDLYAFENIKKVNIFSRIIKSINYLIWGDV